MNKELFGVFGDAAEFRRFRSPTEFDRVIEGGSVTVGVRDVALDVPNRTATWTDGDRSCVVWGEAFAPTGQTANAARWLFEHREAAGTHVLSGLNGSYVAVVDDGDDARVIADPVRSWECFYTDDAGVRVFGTNPVAVAQQLDHPTVEERPLLEFFHLGVVTGDRTLLAGLRRLPFDTALHEDHTRSLRRFVYRPATFDYVEVLAERLERALRRRAANPGRKGVLLSGGYDSRTVLACIDDVETAYTVGRRDAAEVGVARDVAAQYDADHRTLPADERYITPRPDLVECGLGVGESLHIHHGGYTDLLDVDTMYHGLLCDTILRGYFLPRDGVTVRGYRFPLGRLDPDPDLAATVGKKFGFRPESEAIFPNCDHIEADTSREFIQSVIESGLQRWNDRYDSIYDGIALFGIQNQPTKPFRWQLADRFVESFVAVDAELLDWHLRTPPEHRNTRTFLRALRRIDDDLLAHRPPDRPFDSTRLNEIVGFARRKLPLVRPYEGSWPDRRTLYDRAGLDRMLFGDHPEVHDLPPRLKLRINDVTWWLEAATDDTDLTPADVLCPPFGRSPPVHSLAR